MKWSKQDRDAILREQRRGRMRSPSTQAALAQRRRDQEQQAAEQSRQNGGK